MPPTGVPPSVSSTTRPTRADAGTIPAWAILPLRLFTGFAFAYAGIQKLANRNFFDAKAPSSFLSTVRAVHDVPLDPVLKVVARHPTPFGVAIALGELAVGAGLLLGLWGRVAAGGGMVLAASLWLTVSWHARPWYTGADVVWLFALTPILLGGSGQWSFDRWLADPARAGGGPDVERRAVLRTLEGAGAAALVTAAVGALAALFGRQSTTKPSLGPAQPSTPAAGNSSSGSGAANDSEFDSADSVAAASVPVGGAVAVNAPSGQPAFVCQASAGSFTALSAICTHQGCAVQWLQSAQHFQCPCHGARFALNGSVQRGPAGAPLQRLTIHRRDDRLSAS